jgi:hypothetical protein
MRPCKVYQTYLLVRERFATFLTCVLPSPREVMCCLFQYVGGAKLLKGAGIALKMLKIPSYATRWCPAHLQALMDAPNTIKNKITYSQQKTSMIIDYRH